ncbi:protein spire homolog 1-like isoform X4 [Pomacea canaliculata]|uniref:protein spire homolog 1-like isoform X4 n=1 Tax=Pomacea canaliculata TaxID=400727 RepID=UPI000D740040|nr:protein spire homolog 1-like isoform X4 [Pomacea canaliculata]
MASGSSHRRVEVARIPDSDLLPLLDILKYFNNPINEEQAWAVCYQCAQFYLREQSQQKYQELYEYGLQCVCLDRDGEIQIRVRAGDPNGSGKGPPKGQYYAIRKWHATEHDAVQMLGRIIFEALDYGIGEAEERPLSHGLETLIECMTRAQESGENTDNESQSADDEGIEKDAEDDHHCSFREVARLCTQHLSSRQDASYHYRAVCRALMAEAVELRTFLDKISSSKERLHSNEDEDKRLLELERTDWARLWVQVMRSLRQGVRLKKNEHVSHPPVEYELTPFEMLLEDIRSRRYTLHKIMVNGDIPPKVKNDAHAVILDFIRSRPPLRQVKDRKLRSLPPKPPDPHEQLLLDIRAKPKLRPVKDGRLVVYEDSLIADLFILETSRTKLGGEDSPPVTRRVIKPDFSLFLTSSFEESEEDSEVESPERTPQHRRELWKLSPLNSPAKDMNATWHSAASLMHLGGLGHNVGNGLDGRNTRLQRRHTIMVCESPTDPKLPHKELPPLEEVEEPSPSEEQTPRLQRGSDSTLSGLPDHTMHNGLVLLRGSRHQGALYKTEHRRSLTTGLTAIPEDEDNADSGVSCDPTSPGVASRRHSMPSNFCSGFPSRGGSSGGGSGFDGSVKRVGGVGSDCMVAEKVSLERRFHNHNSGGSRLHHKHLSYTLAADKSLEEEEEEGEGTSSETDLALLTASEMMHVSWKTQCQRSATNSSAPCQDCRPVPMRYQKRWQNPIECLSLTLEEVTHIRSVLTKAELESLISHPDLYHQVSKSKVCFTCKTTRFTLFGEWGTKCKFCKRTVCSKCMRKMHVPTEHFKNIPVYTLQSHAIYQRSSGADTELRQNKFLNRCLIQRPNILQAHQNLCAGSTEGKATSSALPVSEPSEQKCFCKCPEHCSR